MSSTSVVNAPTVRNIHANEAVDRHGFIWYPSIQNYTSRDVKCCELCGRFFSREWTLVKGLDGTLRVDGKQYCPTCSQKVQDLLAKVTLNQKLKYEEEAREVQKDTVQTLRRRGARHVKDGRKRQTNSMINRAVKILMNKSITAMELGDRLGRQGQYLIQQLRNNGYKVQVVGTIMKGKYARNLYRIRESEIWNDL